MRGSIVSSPLLSSMTLPPTPRHVEAQGATGHHAGGRRCLRSWRHRGGSDRYGEYIERGTHRQDKDQQSSRHLQLESAPRTRLPDHESGERLPAEEPSSSAPASVVYCRRDSCSSSFPLGLS